MHPSSDVVADVYTMLFPSRLKFGVSAARVD
jgi:hypothetical protein